MKRIGGVMYMGRFLVVTKWSYPFGGGEAYCHELLQWLSSRYDCVWISFTTPDNTPHERVAIRKKYDYTTIELSGGFQEEVLCAWARLLRPEFVYVQGMMRYDIVRALAPTRIPLITGLHFWNDVLRLSPLTYNRDILAHTAHHSLDPKFDYIRRHAHVLSVSRFVSDVLHHYCGEHFDVLYPTTSEPHHNIATCVDRKFVTMVNVHKLKGGEYFLYLLRNTNYPLLGIVTEYHSEELDKEIRAAMRPNCKLLGRQEDMEKVYAETRVMLCVSQVDETFGRVAVEAMHRRIPVLSSHKGNLQHLFAHTAPITSLEECKEALDRVYGDDAALEKMGNDNHERYLSEYSEAVCRERTLAMLERVRRASKWNNVALFVPFCDQGLGIQGRHYQHILESGGRNVFVFSYKPYHVQNGTAQQLQKNGEEWKGEVYYSKNDREHVTDEEVTEFVRRYNIGHWITPETCWYRVFEIAALLRRLDVRTYAVPNIEIVRRDEIDKHRLFDTILCNNIVCMKFFEEQKFTNCHYVGYGLQKYSNDNSPALHSNTITQTTQNNSIQSSDTTPERSAAEFAIRGGDEFDSSAVRVLLVGGLNAITRKGAIQALRAMQRVTRRDVRMTITVQKYGSEKLRELSAGDDRVTLIDKHLSHRDIMRLYLEHDIVLHISRSEGLGLGFYEALSTNTPILSLNRPPHCEIVAEHGILIDAEPRPMPDNNAAVIPAWYIDIDDLAAALSSLTHNQCAQWRRNLERTDHYTPFRERFLRAIIP